MIAKLALAGSALALGLAATSAHATVLATYNDFSSTAGLTLVGGTSKATTADGAVLRLTPAGNFQNGAAYSTTAVTLGNGSTFSTRFQFRFTGAGGIAPADGITFVLSAATNGLGNVGGGLGYQGVPNSVAIEFDTFNNGSGDHNSSNHVGVDVNGDTNSVVLASPYGVATCDFGSTTPYSAAGCLANGDKWTATITYDGALLSAVVQDGTAAPQTIISNYVIDVGAALGTNTAFVGFTGSTGSGFENQDVLDWQFADTAALPPTPPTPTVPEPASLALLAAALIGTAAAARRPSRR